MKTLILTAMLALAAVSALLLSPSRQLVAYGLSMKPLIFAGWYRCLLPRPAAACCIKWRMLGNFLARSISASRYAEDHSPWKR